MSKEKEGEDRCREGGMLYKGMEIQGRGEIGYGRKGDRIRLIGECGR